MTPIIVTILMHVILCHVAQRKESKLIVALPRMGYVVMKCIVVISKVTSVVLMEREKSLAGFVVRLISESVAVMGVAPQILLFVVPQQMDAVPKIQFVHQMEIVLALM